MNCPQDVVIFGTGDLAEVACAYLNDDSPYRVVAFTVHSEHLTDRSLLGRDVVPFEELERHFPPAQCAMFAAIGYRRLNRAREAVYLECKARGYRMIRYVNSRATVSAAAEIGDNCFILEENVVQPFVTIGNNVILWSGNHVGHHARIDDHCFIASHVVLSGRVRVGRYSFVGVNAAVAEGVTVAERNIIGAGALITRDTSENEVYQPERTKPARVPADRLWAA